ncbi:response regulator transcription factor [Streptomyces sp. NPDC005574]|uniref:response regulator transcription factor n=1 Tax=Streptomyces sp. NPDC005574 TaxID=3156891 RepID=UPI0033BCB4A6
MQHHPPHPHPHQPRPSSEPFPAAAPAGPVQVLVADDNPVVRAGLTALLSGRPDMTVVAEAADGRAACLAARRHRPDVILLDVRMPGVDGLAALPHLAGIAPVLMLTYSGDPEIVEEALRGGAGGYLVHGEFTTEQLVTAVKDVRQGRAHFTPTAADVLLAQLRRSNPSHVQPAGYDALARTTLSRIPSPPTSPEALSRLQPDMGQSSPEWTSGRPAAPDRSLFQLSTREAEIMDHIASGMTNQQIAAVCFISEKTVKNHINRIFAKLGSTSRTESVAKWLGTASNAPRGVL